MIDLHLHTTASDGHCSSAELLARASAAGIRTLSVTDHDTMAAVAEVISLAPSSGVDAVPGIEITAVWRGMDVHLLGYFLDPDPPGLGEFLASQRRSRMKRLTAVAMRLAALGMPVTMEEIIRHQPDRRRSLGRPHVARALVRNGYVATVREAFDRWLGDGKPAFVPRQGPPPEQVIETVAGAGGVVSLAHPGLLKHDELIAPLAAAGLGALEVYHSRHDRTTERRLLQRARALGLAVTGGSDYHGDTGDRAVSLGVVGLPPGEFRGLRQRLVRAHEAVRHGMQPEARRPS